MAAYYRHRPLRYRPARRYRGYGRAQTPPAGGIAIAVAIAAALAGATGAAHAVTAKRVPVPGPVSGTAAVAIAYARAQLGKPYCWGGTGSSCYDCSGLVYEAYGASIPRTSQGQWAALPHIPASRAQPGDLVLAPGSDGTWAAPGHVGLLLPGGLVEQAYAAGYPISIVTLATFGQGAGGIVGFAQPPGVS